MLLLAQNNDIRILGHITGQKKSSPDKRAKWKSRTVKSIHQLNVFLFEDINVWFLANFCLPLPNGKGSVVVLGL